MDLGAWADSRWRGTKVAALPARHEELTRRLRWGELSSWQEWILFKRVDRVLRKREDYGVTQTQFETWVRIDADRATAWEEETLAQRLTRMARSADVPLLVDWESLAADNVDAADLVPVSIGSAAEVLHELGGTESLPWMWLFWDVTPQGVAVTGASREGTTSRVRIYDVSELVDGSPDRSQELLDVIMELIEPESWFLHGGRVSGVFEVADHLVVIATSRVHLAIADVLSMLHEIRSAGPPARSFRPVGNLRAFRLESEGGAGILDNLRYAATVSTHSLRSAGPAFDDGVTEDELNSCDREAFGLLDALRP
jgi:hypothetical protein